MEDITKRLDNGNLTVEKDLQPVYAVWCPKLRKFVIFVENKCTRRVEQYIYISDRFSFEQVHRPDIEYNPFRQRSESNVILTVNASENTGVTVILRDQETKSFRKEQFCMTKKCFVVLPPSSVKTIQAAVPFRMGSAYEEIIDAIIERNLRESMKEELMMLKKVAPKPVRQGDIHDQQFFDIDNELVIDYKSAVTYRQLTHFVKKNYLEWLENLGAIGNNWVEEEKVKIKEEVNSPPTMESEEVLLDHFFHMSTSLKKATVSMLQTHLKVFWIDVEALDMPIVNKMKKILKEEGETVDLKEVLTASELEEEEEDVGEKKTDQICSLEDVFMVIERRKRVFACEEDGLKNVVEQMTDEVEESSDSEDSEDSFTYYSPSENESEFEMI